MNFLNKIKNSFSSRFSVEPTLFSAPGRINLIGEHTDYNDGLVLPAAINKYIFAAISKRDDQEIHLFSEDYQEEFNSTVDNIEASGKLWPDYILGVVLEIQKAGNDVGGFNMVFGGDIPLGAGLSSSAALESVTAVGLNAIFDLALSPLQLAKIGQAAENNFVGVNCGLMDQFASIFGKQDHLIRLDCRSLQHEYIPFRMQDYQIVLFDTQVKHSLASSAYNERRRQCERGVALIQEHHPEVTSLRDASMEMLDEYVRPADPLVYQRCHFVVSEIRRLEEACKDLIADDLVSFGRRMYETHEGLKNDYEVSCPELDFLVARARLHPQIIGARMMGGGFGGCTINLVHRDAVDRIASEMLLAYKVQLELDLAVYFVSIVDGAKTEPK
jgi:galactokinase